MVETVIGKFIARLEALSPFPYWGNHIVVALLIGLVTGQPLIGAAVYIGREIYQRFQKGYWDHIGWVAPTAAMVLWQIIKIGI